MKSVGRVKVMKNHSGIHVLPLNEEEIRKTDDNFPSMANASPNTLLLTQQGLTYEQQDMLNRIRAQNSRTPQLISDS